MKKSILSSLLALALSLGGQAGYAIPTELVTNGGFETGGLNGWSASPNVAVWGTHNSVSAYRGNYMAVMSPWAAGNSYLFQSVQIDTSAYDTFDISFAYNMQAYDYWYRGRDCEDRDYGSDDSDCGDDSLSVSIGGENLLSISLNDEFGGGSTIAGWKTFEKKDIPNIGEATLDFEFYVHNLPNEGGDLLQLFTAYIDDVSITGYGNGVASAVPVPGTLALFGVGLLGLAGIRRRRATLVS